MSGPRNINIRNLSGENGLIFKTAAGALTIPTGRRVIAIHAHSVAVVNVTLANAVNSDASSAVPIPASDTWIASCSAVTLTSGVITAYLDTKNG
jgi:hypothetical protein